MKKLSIKKFPGAMAGLLLLLSFGCTKTDNLSGPDSAFQGNIIDSVTGKNLVTETGAVQIELRQLSWSDNPSPYDIPSKPDGTFEDTRIFSGHYSVIPTKGAFWPTDSIVTDIKGATKHDFTVVPYLEVVNLTHVVNADTLTVTFQLKAPRTNGLPQILDASLFVNNTPFVGSGAFLQAYYLESTSTVHINANWSDAIGATVYTVSVNQLQAGWNYHARVGVRVADSYQKYDLSDIIEIRMPGK